MARDHILPFHTTVTERGSFRDCRRRWYLENIELLEPVNATRFPLRFGTIVHEALDHYYSNTRDVEGAIDVFNTAWRVEDDDLCRSLAEAYTSEVEQEWFDHLAKGQKMLKYYDIHDRASGFFDKVVDVGVGFDAWRQNVTVEERFFVEILGLDGAPTGDLLSGRIDLITLEPKKPANEWITDHKTAVSAPVWRALEVDDQLTGYCYMRWRMTGKVPRGALYNVLLKDPPKPPRVLKAGTLSMDKAQRTTYDLFIAAIEEYGLSMSDYAEFLDFLKEKGWTTFFPRSENVRRNGHEVRNFETRLRREIYDMKTALDSEIARYPNPNQRNCGMCSVVPICQAMEDGSDVDSIKASMYRVKQPRHTIPPEIIANLERKEKGGPRKRNQ